MFVVIREVQVTRSPPPFAESLHWTIVTGNSEDTVEVGTVHWTRWVAPPLLPAVLHSVMSAPEAEDVGAQLIVGWVPPPCPDPMHWLTLAGLVEPMPMMLFTMRTLQVTMEPPAFTELLHWLTEPTMSVVVAPGVVLQNVAAVPGAPAQTVVVTVERVVPLAMSMMLTTVTLQMISRAAPVST